MLCFVQYDLFQNRNSIIWYQNAEVNSPIIMLNPMVKLASLVFSLNCSAMMLDVKTAGIADSKTVILAIFPFIPKSKASNNVMAGAKTNLYSMETDICGINFFHPLNFNCKPTENRASGLTVAEK